MKTLLKTTALLVTLTVLFSVNLNASVFEFNEEPYIDDIPFDTKEVYNDIIAEQSLVEFNFEEEGYIDDIPFDTKCISTNCLYLKAMNIEFDFEEEEFIDDIPFNTECISVNCLFSQATAVEFNFEEETYIDDIEASVFYVSIHLFPEIVDLLISDFLITFSNGLR